MNTPFGKDITSFAARIWGGMPQGIFVFCPVENYTPPSPECAHDFFLRHMARRDTVGNALKPGGTLLTIHGQDLSLGACKFLDMDRAVERLLCGKEDQVVIELSAPIPELPQHAEWVEIQSRIKK